MIPLTPQKTFFVSVLTIFESARLSLCSTGSLDLRAAPTLTKMQGLTKCALRSSYFALKPPMIRLKLDLKDSIVTGLESSFFSLAYVLLNMPK